MTWTVSLQCPQCGLLSTLEGPGGRPTTVATVCRRCDTLYDETDKKEKS